MGPHRFYRRLDHMGGVTDLIETLTARLEDALLGVAGQPRDVTLGRVCSWIEVGGFVHAHNDRYPLGSAQCGRGHLRANVVVQMDASGLPVIEGEELPV